MINSTLQGLCHSQQANNSALLRTNRNAEIYTLLRLEYYLQRMSGRNLLYHDLREPNQTPPPVSFSANKFTKEEKVSTTCKER